MSTSSRQPCSTSVVDPYSSTSAGPDAAANLMLATDIRTGLIITLIGSFLMVAVSVGVNQASSTLDQRELHRSLHDLGVPVEEADAVMGRPFGIPKTGVFGLVDLVGLDLIPHRP